MWVYLIAALIFAGAVGGSYVKGREDGRDLEIATETKAEKLVGDAKAEMAAVAASAIANIQVKNTTIQGRVIHDIQTNTLYRDCRNTPDGLRNLNDALTNAVSPVGPASGGQLSGPDAPR